MCNKRVEVINVLNKNTRIFFKLKNKTVSCFYHKVFIDRKEGNLFIDDEIQETWNTNFIVNRDKEKLTFLLSVIKNTKHRIYFKHV